MKTAALTHLDLFSGVGGFTLAAQAIGFQTVAFCEIDPFCHQVLKKHWPETPCHEDIKTLDGTQYAGITLVTGGFPCQPTSLAGRRRGAADHRWLWPEMARIVRQARPTWVIAENPIGLRTLGLAGVLDDLEAAGYQVAVVDIPACAVGAPHRRQRLWIIAHAATARCSGPGRCPSGPPSLPAGSEQCNQSPADSDGVLCRCEIEGRQAQGGIALRWPDWSEPWPEVATGLCRVDDGLPGKLDKHRRARLRALGNAIVPQVAYEILKVIASLP